MSKTSYVLEVPFGRFFSRWDDDGVECPKCHRYFRMDVDPLLAIASDVLCDICTSCGTYIVVDKTLPDPVVIEGFRDASAMNARAEALLAMKGREQPGKARSRHLPWWKRIFGGKA